MPLVAGAMLASSVLWAFHPSLAEMERRWAEDTHYSHGYLVPLFALALLWLRRDQLHGRRWRPSWWGAAFILAAAGLRGAGGYLYLDWLNQLALLPTMAGVCLLCGGWAALRWSWPAIVFLFFMIPLPYRVQIALGGPLQHLATTISTYLLQTLGFAAVAEGNIILIDKFQIGVVEACNGLGMLLTFVALTAGLVLVVRRPLLDKLLILASSLPIAVAANVTRIAVTAALSKFAGNEAANVFFHDLAGWFMMPVALALLLVELELLRRLLVETVAPAPLRVVSAGGRSTSRDRRMRASVTLR
jgi:exosortase